ncbi:unnamed protein product [Auanema sp. JU1783]|nr:unnamed protein product [Auanema sp. JU1783]
MRFITSDDCPDPNTMQMKCIPSYWKHTNWCNYDHECETGRFHRTESPTVRRLCCPTPCGYNTCLNLASGVYSVGK